MRIVIAEDHYLVREGTRKLLDSVDRIEVVAAVENAVTLLDAVDRLDPDAVITDIRMPPNHQIEGIEAAHHLRANHQDIGIVVLSQHVDPLYAMELFREGTAGLAYLLKDRIGELEELVRALEEVTAGGSVVDPVVVDLLFERQRRFGDSLLDALTERETDVLSEMAQGKTNTAIADALFISQSAVEKHVGSIYTKLGLDNADRNQDRRVAAVLTFLDGTD